MTTVESYASPVDTDLHGDYRILREPGDTRPLYRFDGRITADGSSGYLAEPGRYHLYAGWFCPWAQRTTLQLELNGLRDVVSVSYVDNRRDGRGWAFRRDNGPDRVNGFTLLRDAYERTEPGFDGHVSVPTLWDRRTGRIVSNSYDHVGIDLATAFTKLATRGADTYPLAHRSEIEELDSWIGPAINKGVYGDPAPFLLALERVAELLSTRSFLAGDQFTEADIRLWVTLVRYDAGPNNRGQIGPRLSSYAHVWGYARRLYDLPAFRATTRFSSFAYPHADLSTWS